MPGTWTATLDPIGHNSGTVTIRVRGTALPTGPILSIGAGPLTELLVAPPFYANIGPVPHPGAPVSITTPIPSTAALCGLPWAAQALVTGGVIDLSNGVMGVVGY